MRDWVSNSNFRRCAEMRATSSNRHPGWPETAISAMSQAHHSAPCRAAMLRLDHVRVQYLRQNFERLRDARSRSVEILVPVGEIDPRAEALPIRPLRQP